MNRLFTQYELSYLDDLMPGDDKNKEEDEEAEKVRLGASVTQYYHYQLVLQKLVVELLGALYVIMAPVL